MTWRRVVVGVLLIGSAVACGGGNVAGAVAQAPKYEPGSASKCGTATADWRPMLVEWSAPDRATLESKIGEGLIAARVTGCEIQILPTCRGPSRYLYTATTPKRDTVRIRNTDELQANIPFGAARFNANLARSGELSVRLNVVGIYAAEQAAVAAEDMKGACDSATHIVTGFAAGAFEFSSGADATVGAGVSVAGVGGDGKSTSKREVLNKDGDESKCEGGRSTDTKPPEGCGAVLRLSLAPIACFEGMYYAEGKGCRKLTKDSAQDRNAPKTLVDGVEAQMDLLELQLKDLPKGAPVWAKRTDDLAREWSRTVMKAKFEDLALQRAILEQGSPATSAQTAALERLRRLQVRAERASATHEKALTQ